MVRPPINKKFLEYFKDGAPRTAPALALLLGLAYPVITARIRRLEANGCIIRGETVEGKRKRRYVVTYTITDKGKAALG